MWAFVSRAPLCHMMKWVSCDFHCFTHDGPDRHCYHARLPGDPLSRHRVEVVGRAICLTLPVPLHMCTVSSTLLRGFQQALRWLKQGWPVQRGDQLFLGPFPKPGMEMRGVRSRSWCAAGQLRARGYTAPQPPAWPDSMPLVTKLP